MPPKAKFTKEEIIAAALEIVETDGADALTARSLGEKLGSSARPIFTVFDGMKEVSEEVVASAKAVYGGYVEEGLKETPPFKGVGKSYIRFAAERPKLFQLLFMKENGDYPDKANVLQGIEEHYENILDSIRLSYGLSREKCELLYQHLWIYSHGIAVLIATKVCRFTAEEISEMLTQVFKGIIKDILSEEKNDKG